MSDTFGSHIPSQTTHPMGGVQYRFKFDNGYGASVIRHNYSYGGDQGLWEVGVLGTNDRLTYDTPITNDVLGYLTDAEVTETLDQIAALAAESVSA